MKAADTARGIGPHRVTPQVSLACLKEAWRMCSGSRASLSTFLQQEHPYSHSRECGATPTTSGAVTMRWRRCLPVRSGKGCRESCREHQVSPSPPRGRGGDKAAEASHRDEREMSPMVVWTVM